ncbi:MAG: cell wall hydrolase [Paludibacteraceae bacterium]|nr:cell wall hydrolase [Paludibacteraceae bacterium]
MRVKITELKITLCLILLFIIMVSIALCSHSESSEVKYPESTITIDTSKTHKTEPDVQIDKIETNETSFEEEVTEVATEEVTTIIEEVATQNEPQLQPEILIGSEEFGSREALMLHKIAIAEAGGESVESMAIIINVIINRVMSEKFPNSIEEVIFQITDGVAQFSPIIDGNYDRAEPNEKSYEAMEMVLNGQDETQGALYFEACEYGGSWHSTALEFLFEKDGIRYYK